MIYIETVQFCEMSDSLYLTLFIPPACVQWLYVFFKVVHSFGQQHRMCRRHRGLGTKLCGSSRTLRCDALCLAHVTASDLLVNDEPNWLGSEESVSGEPIFKLGGGSGSSVSESLVSLKNHQLYSVTDPLNSHKKETNKQKGQGGGRKKSMKRRVIIIYMEPVLCCLSFILRKWWFRRRNTLRRMLYESL